MPAPVEFTQANFAKFVKQVEGQIRKAGFAILLGVQDAVHEPSGLRMNQIAAIHEYGTADGRVPARAPFAKTMAIHRNKYRDAIKRATKHILQTNTFAAPERIGLAAVGDVQQSISAGLAPALKPATVAAKGSSTPLVDTGKFRQSITHKVIR